MFAAHGKSQILKDVLQFLKGVANVPWVAKELSNPQSLTGAAVARGPIWLCAFGRKWCMVAHQNRRQKVVNRRVLRLCGGLYVRAGGLTLKFDENSTNL